MKNAWILSLSLFANHVHVSVAFVMNPRYSKCPPQQVQADQLSVVRMNTSETPWFAKPIPFVNINKEQDVGVPSSSPDMLQMEKEVVASTQAKLDDKRVKGGVLGTGKSDSIDLAIKSAVAEVLLSTEMSSVSTVRVHHSSPPSQMNIALVAGSILGLTSFAALQTPILSFAVFMATTVIASKDPVDDEELAEGDLTGLRSRIVGRTTLDSLEKTTPTVRAVRADVSGKKFERLRLRCQQLEEQNVDLMLRIKMRDAIDEQNKHYTLDNLKEMARRDDVKIGGTKAELMMRLIEAGSLNLLDC